MIRAQYPAAQLERGLVSFGGRVRVAIGIEINSEIVGGRERVGMLGTKNPAPGGVRLLVQAARRREPAERVMVDSEVVRGGSGISPARASPSPRRRRFRVSSSTSRAFAAWPRSR